MSQLEDWISSDVIQRLNEGGLNEYFYDLPFRAGGIENFFKEDIFNELKLFAGKADRSKFSEHSCKYYYAPFLHKEFFKFINSPKFIEFLTGLSTKKVKRFDEFPYPQLHSFSPSSEGLFMHTDHGSGRDFATLMYMNDEWSPQMGGELVLYKKVGEAFESAEVIAPKPNSLFFFETNEVSYHAVSPMIGDWKRDTVITDWRLV